MRLVARNPIPRPSHMANVRTLDEAVRELRRSHAAIISATEPAHTQRAS